MKKLLSLLVSLSLSLILQAQVSKTINITDAGTLYSYLSKTERTTVTNLTITGTIDARDFVTMRDSLPKLAVLDLGNSDIAACTTYDDVDSFIQNVNPENAIPNNSFYKMTHYGIYSLKAIILPQSITSIGSSAFEGCSRLDSITIPALVTSIGNRAFQNCEGMAIITFTLPSALKHIGYDTFGHCSSLLSVSIPHSVTSIDDYAFYACSIASLTIPSSVTTIGKYAFGECTNLMSLTIPSSASFIDNGAFCGCINIQSIYVPSISPADLSSSAYVFTGINKTMCTLYVPFGSKNAYQNAEQWKDFNTIEEYDTTIITMVRPATYTNIAIYPNPATTSITIPNENESTVQIFATNGSMLLNTVTKGKKKISITMLPTGSYFVNIITGNTILTGIFIKQ